MKNSKFWKKALRRGLAAALSAGMLTGCADAVASQVQATAVSAADQAVPAVSLPAAFDGQSKWDWMDNNFDLAVTTGGAPREGVVFTADLLVPSAAKPQFRGRINLEVILLVGAEQRWVQCAVPAQVRAINFAESVTRDGRTWYRTKVSVTFAGTVQTSVDGQWTEGVPYQQAVNQAVTGVKVYAAGTLCDYKGTLRLENPALGYTLATGDGVSVNTTVSRHDLTGVSVQQDALVLENGTRQAIPQVTLCDPSATAAAVQTARYLAAMGSTDHVIFGHQDSVWEKAGTEASPLNGLTDSDIEDMTGSLPGIIGFDGLSLIGSDFSAARWNTTYAWRGLPAIDVDALGEAAANVKALAALTNYCLNRGTLVTLSCHMPNFSQVKERAGYQAGKEPSYARYDFSSSTARVKDGDTMAGILPGGAYNAPFTAYLDMVADYASQVEGAVLFRPFHEGTGEWFWWGNCDAETYQKVFRYTVEYLRDKKQVHNLIYVYSPDANPGFMTEAVKRYPGDAYVDMIGFDNYQTDPAADSSQWFADFASGLAQIGQFAAQHGKLLAVTEVGVNTTTPAPGDVATGLPRTGCPDKQWFEKVLDTVSASRACYVLAWSNNEEMFHTPFVRAVNGDGSLYGHELLDDFLRFYNDSRSVFALNQSEIVRGFR